jgi:hypothetical protein
MRKRKPAGATRANVISPDFGKTAPPQGPPKTRAALAAMNERFAVITGGQHAGRVVDLSRPSQPQFLTKERFTTMFENKCVSTGSGTVPISKAWLQMKGRREITGLVFEPTDSPHHVPAGAHNMWQGFAVEPKEGKSHRRLLNHIRRNVCHGDKKLLPGSWPCSPPGYFDDVGGSIISTNAETPP